MEDRTIDPPQPVWVTTPRFSSADDVQPGLMFAWERDLEDRVWRAQVWCLRETAAGLRGPDYRGSVPATRVQPRDTTSHWSAEVDGGVARLATTPSGHRLAR